MLQVLPYANLVIKKFFQAEIRWNITGQVKPKLRYLLLKIIIPTCIWLTINMFDQN
jgi:hypothetical protein